MRVNDEGAASLAAAAASVGAKIVHPSSDYVFDGSSRRPYVESDMHRGDLGLRALEAGR